jgi:hypothetical protein
MVFSSILSCDFDCRCTQGTCGENRCKGGISDGSEYLMLSFLVDLEEEEYISTIR